MQVETIAVMLLILAAIACGLFAVFFVGRSMEPLLKVKRIIYMLAVVTVISFVGWYRHRQGLDLFYAISLVFITIAAWVYRQRIAAGLAANNVRNIENHD